MARATRRATRTPRERGSRPFVGRASELAQIASFIAEDEPGLLTLLGAPGIGKSRLAAESTRDLDGMSALVVGLRGAGDDDVLARVAEAADVSRADLTSIVRALGARIDLLVLDDCDGARAGAAALLTRLAERAPGVRTLATSRRPLGLPAERTLIVEGLGVPRGSEPLEHSASGALLFALARARAASWSPTTAEEPALRRVLMQLGDLPLAIELIAPQLVEMGAAALAARVDEPLDWLVRGAGDEVGGPLRAALRPALAALTPQARTTLTLLALLARPFDADDAELFCGRDALATLRHLRESSWLVKDRRAGYDVLAPLRQFIVEADAGALASARETQLAEAQLRGALRGRAAAPEQLERAMRHAAQHPRLAPLVAPAVTAAYARFAAAGRADRFATLIDELAREPGLASARAVLVRVRARAAIDGGRFDEARAAIGALAALEGEDAVASLRARLHFRTGDYEALGTLEASVRPTDPEDVELFATAASIRGDRALAVAIHRRALDRSRGEAAPRVGAMLARLLIETGDAAGARTELERIAANVDPGGASDPRLEASLETTRALLDHDEARPDAAMPHYDRAIALYEAMGNVLASYVRFVRALAALETGRVEETCACFLAALEDTPPEMAQLRPLVALGRWVALGERPMAAAHESPVVAASSELVAAYVARSEGAPDAAARLDRALHASASHASWSVVTRVLRRIAERARPMLSHRRSAASAALLVGDRGAWFAVPDGPRVSLESRPVLMRVLARLAQRAPDGVRASVDDIADAAWPGERMLERAKRARVHVAIATLRNMGLRAHLSHHAAGYRLEGAIVRTAGEARGEPRF